MALISWRKFQAGLRGEGDTKDMASALNRASTPINITNNDMSQFLQLLESWFIVKKWYVTNELRIPIQ